MDINGPHELSDYRKAPRSKGIYVIGSRFDLSIPLCAKFLDDPYFRWCPENFVPRYVGISESKSSGMRGRLSSHARSKGNTGVARLIDSREELWFVCIEGAKRIELEAMFLCLKGGNQFDCNVRDENMRSGKRRYRAYRAEMTPSERDFYDHLDMGPHGNGM